MNITKEKLLPGIQTIIEDGVVNCEEVDVTAQKVVDHIWGLIVYLKDKACRSSGEEEQHCIILTSYECDCCGGTFQGYQMKDWRCPFCGEKQIKT